MGILHSVYFILWSDTKCLTNLHCFVANSIFLQIKRFGCKIFQPRYIIYILYICVNEMMIWGMPSLWGYMGLKTLLKGWKYKLTSGQMAALLQYRQWVISSIFWKKSEILSFLQFGYGAIFGQLLSKKTIESISNPLYS